MFLRLCVLLVRAVGGGQVRSNRPRFEYPTQPLASACLVASIRLSCQSMPSQTKHKVDNAQTAKWCVVGDVLPEMLGPTTRETTNFRPRCLAFGPGLASSRPEVAESIDLHAERRMPHSTLLSSGPPGTHDLF